MQKYIAILLVLLSANLFAQTYIDIDLDNDGLIEVNDLETLNAMRYQLDGSGLQLSETAVEITTGCAPGGCKGYELTRDLDFSSADSYQNIANLKHWTDGAGWQPIGDAVHPFTAIFKTNNGSTPNVIYNLMINRPSESSVGLFGHIGSSAKISGIGLLNAELSGHSQVGGLVGKSVGGDISNSYVSGRVVGKGVEVGSLAGSSSGSITNSYANGEVSSQGNGVGGLVGASSGSITNSYAMGSVVGAANHVGGLVGDNSQGTISSSYTTGIVSGGEDIGGLVGISNLGKLIGNYVSGKTSGKRYIGGLVGINVGGTITRSYWDKTTNKLTQNTGGVGLSASELQSQNAQDDDSNKPYYKWSTANWDFGTAEQYPILKYATGSDPQNPACGPGQTLPNCGALLLGQHASLERIIFSERVDLSPTFKPTELNYQLNISPQITQLQLTPIANNPASAISISRNGIAVGTTSSVITLDKDTSITVAVSAPNQRPAQYQFAVNYRHTITILGIPNETINEGELIVLNASHSLDTAEDQISYRWTQTTGKTILPETANESASLLLFIPADYVPTTEDYAGLGLSIEVTDGKTTLNKNISLMVAKKDNGNIVVASPSLSDMELTAPEIDLSEDSDGAGNSFSYQWQHRPQSEDAEWTNLDDATDKTYTIPASAEWFTEYRVLIGYTDGQGYETIATSEATQYPSEEAIQDFIQSTTPQRQSLENANPPRIISEQSTLPIACSSPDVDDDNDGLIEICYLEDLDAIRNNLAGRGNVAQGCPNTGCKGYELARDLDFNDNDSYRSASANKSKWTTGLGWQPIGEYIPYTNVNSNPFSATFEGNGYTVSNLMINRPSTNYVGMFSYIESTSTKITNVGLLNVDITGGWYDAGGLVGWNNGGTITNSYAAGSATATNVAGVLVGINSGTITNSYAMGFVSAASWYAGVLVGINSGTITNSYATGSATGNSRLGGLVGVNEGSILNSYATGNITATNNYAGGLVGVNEGSILNSYATGNVTATNSYAGGLVGHNVNVTATITNSYAIGNVEGGREVGGLVGFNNVGTITNSYATGNVVARQYYVGGLVGRNWRGTITNSYWDINTSGMTRSAGGTGKTTIELQSTVAPSADSNQPYYQWDDENWDFGSRTQYPALKYATGPDTNNPACGGEGKPVCGELLPGQLRLAISPGTLSFDAQDFSYTVMVNHNVTEITLNTTATNAAIRITSNTTGITTGTGVAKATIPLKIAGNTVITVELTIGNQRPKSYVITVSYYDLGTPTSSDITIKANKGGGESDIDEGNSVDVNEGDSLELKLGTGSCNTKCEWDIPSTLGSLLPANVRLNGETITFTNIPVDYISPSEDSRQFTITAGVRRPGGIARRQITLTINKADNGYIELGEATLIGSSLIATDLPDLSTDPDGVNDNPNISYQWQQLRARNLNPRFDGNWMNITGATTRTYIPSTSNDGEIYRVGVSYMDGQNNDKTVYSKNIENIDIDIDDDGLIEIRTLDDLDAIRFVLDGSGYKGNAMARIDTKGCPATGCKGYELVNDLDFLHFGSYESGAVSTAWTTDTGWEPIRDNFNSFSGIFKGNNHTISNLMINRPSSSYIGLFFMTSGDAMIDGVNLDKIKVTGRNHVGTLVGKNLGSITNSNISGDDNTTSTRVKGEDHVGGLVGANGGNALIDNVDVYGLYVKGEDHIGGLAGKNQGTIRRSRVSGTGNTTLTQVIGKGDRIGGLVGSNENGRIFSSHAIADVQATHTSTDVGFHVGGLVGENTGRIMNSYAAGSVVGNANVGGLVGLYGSSQIRNSYAWVRVTGNSNTGGLVGSKPSNPKIIDSYWDTDVSGITEDGSNQGKTTEELQTTSTGIYRDWNPNVWDFGTSEQYPALKHYDRDQCKQTNPPDYCGVLFAGQRSGLQSLQLSGNVILQDNFSNRQYDYNLIIGNASTTINLVVFAASGPAEIKLHKNDGNVELSDGAPNPDIPFADSISTMTLVVKDARSEVSYHFELRRFELDIDYDTTGYREGTTASLKADTTNQIRSIIDINEVSFEWDSGGLSPDMASGSPVDFVIPVNYIKDARTTATATVTLTATYQEQVTSFVSEGLLIIKENNGTAQPQSTTLMVNGRILTAPGLISGTDVDGDPISMEYQWQEQRLGEDWVIVDDSESSTYEIPDATPAYTKYRVTISYKDGQSYSHDNLITTEVYTYIELDADDNGLIDIYSAAQLDAIRHQPDGTAYKASNDGVSTTMGCPDGGCNGYELKGHITLTGIWQPIDNFNTRFEGHGYTISNLNTTTTIITYAGMFARTGPQASIHNVGLINVAINSGNNAGGLVGISSGIIANSYVVGNIIGSSNINGSNAGGLVGINNGTISTSHAIVKVGNASSEYVGGLAGINNGTINNSYVIAKQLTGTSTSNVGGIIGKTDNQDTSIVTNSYATVETIIKDGNRAGTCSLSGDGDGIDDTSRMLGGNCIPSTLFDPNTTR